jgi:hypothetical protein
MRTSIKAWSLLVAGGVLCCFSVALAQNNTDSFVQINSQHDENLSLPLMLQRAQAFKPQMDNDAASVQRQASAAKQAHDVVKSLCLGDKLSQIHVAVTTASGRIDTLSSAVSHNDSDRAKHEFTIIEVLKDRSSALVAEANQCIGEDTGFIGESAVTVTIDPNIPDTDPSNLPDYPIVSEPPVVSQPPVVTSPTM